MSYTFTLRPANAKHRRHRNARQRAEIEARMQRECAILRAFEPDIALVGDGGQITACSAQLGDVYIEPGGITLAMSMGSDAHALYAAIHGVMKCFHDQDYVAKDPQLRAGTVEYREAFADFMQQYREHFDCLDDEFEQWCRGETPPAWAERARRRERDETAARLAFPPQWPMTWQDQSAWSDDALWQHFTGIVAQNNASIQAHGLQAYLARLTEGAGRANPDTMRRYSGGRYPFESDASWFCGSLLHYEGLLLGELRRRNYPAAMPDRMP